MAPTTIRISKENRKRLNDVGRKSDTYDDIIGRLLDYVEKNGITFEQLNGKRRKK